MSKPTNSLVKAIQKNDPRRFHTRVRHSVQKRIEDAVCDCGMHHEECMCHYETEDDE